MIRKITPYLTAFALLAVSYTASVFLGDIGYMLPIIIVYTIASIVLFKATKDWEPTMVLACPVIAVAASALTGSEFLHTFGSAVAVMIFISIAVAVVEDFAGNDTD